MRVFRRLSYANVVSTLALFIALGGASLAAVELPRRSVGRPQLRPEAVSASKIAPGAVGNRRLSIGSVGTDNLRTGSVTADKLAPGTIPTITSQPVDAGSRGQVQTVTLARNPCYRSSGAQPGCRPPFTEDLARVDITLTHPANVLVIGTTKLEPASSDLSQVMLRLNQDQSGDDKLLDETYVQVLPGNFSRQQLFGIVLQLPAGTHSFAFTGSDNAGATLATSRLLVLRLPDA